MTEPLISAAMIVRDEAHHLPACLASIRPLVDEIVIVDTGSTDGTVAIAESFGARVDHLLWAGDFATPRNRSLDLARGRWILYIDADERLQPLDVERARRRFATAQEPALRVRFRSRPGLTPYWEYRLWRSDPRIRFMRQMHETMTPAIAAVVAADGCAVDDSELAIEHVGYEGDLTHKHRRNLPIIRAQLAREPHDPYIQTHLAEVLAATGDAAGAEAALDQAVEAARLTLSPTGPVAFSGLIQHRHQRGQDVAGLLAEALTRYPDNFWLAWHKVQWEIDVGNHAAALQWLERFDVDVEMPVEDIIGYDRTLFTVRAPAARGLCHFRLGQHAQAAAAYGTAEANVPDQPMFRRMRQLNEHRVQRDDAHATAPRHPSPRSGWRARELLRGAVIDMAGVPMALRATDAARASAMQRLLGRMALTDRPAAVELRFDGHQQPVPGEPADEAQHEQRTWYRDHGLFVTTSEGLSGRSWESRARLGGYAPDLGRAFGNAAPPLIATLLAPHDRFLLHAGALQRDGRAILLLGGSGAGKSTLVLGAVDAGWEALSDDLVLLRGGPDGALVTGIARSLSVPHEVVGAPADGLPSQDDLRRRVQVPFDGWDRGEHPVVGCVLVDHGEEDTARVEDVERIEVFGNLLRAMLCRRRASVRRYFTIAGGLCAAPAYRLRHCRDPAGRPREAARALART